MVFAEQERFRPREDKAGCFCFWDSLNVTSSLRGFLTELSLILLIVTELLVELGCVLSTLQTPPNSIN